MFGIIFGTLCLVGLVFLLTRRRRTFGHGGHHRRGFGPRAVLHHVFARLDTAPGQEKVIMAAVEDLAERARDAGRTVRETRKDLAQSLRGEQVDEARLNEVFGRHDAALGDLRVAATDALKRVHEALDERQRKVLSDLVESGGYYAFRGHGHYC